MAGMIVPFLVLAIAFPPPAERGLVLFQECKAEIRVIDSRPHALADGNAARNCEHYITGFVDGLSFDNKLICVNAETPTRTLARLYVSYMEKNPKDLNELQASGLLLALQDAYPCRSK
jgi:hypothetical protein